MVLSVFYSDPVVLDLASTDLDPTGDREAIEHPLVDEIMPSGSHDLAIVLYRARDVPEGEGYGHPTGGMFPCLWFVYFLFFGFIHGFELGFFLGLAASIILQRLRELMAACTRTRVRSPHLDMRVFRYITCDVLTPYLRAFLDDLVIPCLELVRSISRDSLAERYSHWERAHSIHSHDLSLAESVFMRTRQTLRHAESQLMRGKSPCIRCM